MCSTAGKIASYTVWLHQIRDRSAMRGIEIGYECQGIMRGKLDGGAVCKQDTEDEG